MATPRAPRALGGLDRARQQAEDDDLDLQPVRRSLEVLPNDPPVAVEPPVAAVPAPEPEPATAVVQSVPATTIDESLDARRRMGEGRDLVFTTPAALAKSELGLAVEVMARRPKQTFTIQIAAELDRILREEMVRRTAESRKRVNLADLITRAFSADRIPETPAQAETLVCRLPDAVASDATVTTTVRIDDGTHERLALLRARLKQVRSVVLMRDVYTALILDHLGQLPKRAQRELGE